MKRRSFLTVVYGALASVFGWKPKAEQTPTLHDHAEAMGRDEFLGMVNRFSQRKMRLLNLPYEKDISKWEILSGHQDVYAAYMAVTKRNPQPRLTARYCTSVLFSMLERHSSVNVFLARLGERIDDDARDCASDLVSFIRDNEEERRRDFTGTLTNDQLNHPSG